MKVSFMTLAAGFVLLAAYMQKEPIDETAGLPEPCPCWTEEELGAFEVDSCTQVEDRDNVRTGLLQENPFRQSAITRVGLSPDFQSFCQFLSTEDPGSAIVRSVYLPRAEAFACQALVETACSPE